MQGIIIGAGIGGLVTALALQQHGLNVRVFEKMNAPTPEGAGIVLAINAMRVLDKLNLANEVIQKGNEIHGVSITDEKLRPLSPNLIPEEVKKYGFTNVAIHRADLQGILLRSLPDNRLEWGKNCIRISNKEQKYVVHLGEGETAYGDYILAADGIHSTVRKQFFPHPGKSLRDVKQICWRGIAAFDLPEKYNHQAIEAWGRGRRFGFSRINNDLIYWFAVLNKHGNDFNFRKDLKEELKKQFSEFDPLIAAIIEDTAEQRIIRKDLLYLPPIPSWHTGNICLLGDAAHAMTPNLGQGACQAMEDGWVLAALLNESKNPGMAFSQYQKIRKPITDYVAKWSLRVGDMAHYENAALTGLRNLALKRMPRSFFRKKTAKLFQPGYEI